MPKDLLLEIGTEEIPAGFIPRALETIKNRLENYLEREVNISFQSFDTLGTPRRLVVFIKGMAEKQADTVIEAVGPSKRAAFDENGRPTQAAEGFAKKHGVAVKDLNIIQTPKGEHICVNKPVKGKKTKDILQEILPKFIASPEFFPKTMRWGDSDVRFARPIHWIVALFELPSPVPAKPTTSP